jgi:flagellar motor protein MotB
MQRLAVSLSAFALLFVMMVNIALFVQNNQLRKQALAAPAQPQPTQASQSQPQPDQLAELQRQLARSEQDRIKATRDATSARGQLTQLQAAAQERDTYKSQAQSLQQENQQLKLEVGNLQTMNTINSQVAPLRSLSPLANVPREFMNHDQLRAYFTESFAREWSPEAEQRERAVLRALDMDTGNTDLRQAQIDSMVKSVLGFYSQETKQLVVVTDRGQMGVTDKVTYAHEFTHSLQDQHYDLTALFAHAQGNSDYQMALKGLVEGDATLTMGLYARKNLTSADIASYRLEQFQSVDLSGVLTGGGGGPLVESATYFPYQEGAEFAALLYQDGGWKAIDAAFKNPPRSTEQVLHPERYFDGDDPLSVRLPAARPSGWDTIAEDTLGELYLRIYLEHKLDFEQAIPAAQGWGGDRYAVLGDRQGRLALALQTAWDSPADAQEFFDTYSTFVIALAGGNPQPLQSDADHMRWQLADRQIYLSRAGSQVLVLHGPDAATLDGLIAQFKGF